ncbi:hypothetical protein DFP72DRAFT_83519 [Ephemerocybe angulata]|uniref:Uncharacterized protein n=1 Tax=Ephemerocybe angulata TaxID=980116 RepID=A0A8H6LVJ9_9AGAR|nr:hypothetical protein DFP72DRAFT_83519 [Tulosesus angulatus]
MSIVPLQYPDFHMIWDNDTCNVPYLQLHANVFLQVLRKGAVYGDVGPTFMYTTDLESEDSEQKFQLFQQIPYCDLVSCENKEEMYEYITSNIGLAAEDYDIGTVVVVSTDNELISRVVNCEETKYMSVVGLRDVSAAACTPLRMLPQRTVWEHDEESWIDQSTGEPDWIQRVIEAAFGTYDCEANGIRLFPEPME